MSDPRDAWRSYRVATRLPGARHVDADRWQQRTPVLEGSWWPEWIHWLDARSSPDLRDPPRMGAADVDIIADAPGSFVLMRQDLR